MRLRLFLLTSVLWTSLILGSGWFLWRNELGQAEALAVEQARATYLKDFIFRKWASEKGGVYVPVSEKTAPNPYLAGIQERDITTPSGRKLTLVNPAYMTRQVHELAKLHLDERGHITSLKPIRPENGPDDWEARALARFEAGETEVYEVTRFQGRDQLRLMRPLMVEESCIKCHSSQGYQVGDVRGGISVSTPFEPYLEAALENTRQFSAVLGVVWLLGLLGMAATNSLLSRSEQRMLHSSEYLKSLLLSMQDMVFVLDRDLRFTDYHSHTQEKLYLPAEHFLGRRFDEVGLPRGVERSIRQAIEHTRATGESARAEYCLDMPQGRVWFDLCASPYHSSRDSTGGITCVVRDITELKQSQAALLEAEAQYHTLVDHSQSLIYMLSKEGILTFASPSWKTLLGYAPEDVVGSGFRPLIFPDDLPACEEYLKVSIEKKAAQPAIEFRIYHCDGSLRWHRMVINPVMDEDGCLTGFVGNSVDITERKQAEDQIRSINERMLLAAKAARFGVWDYDIVHDHLEWDEALHEIYGIPREMFVPNSEGWQSLIHPEDLEATVQHLTDTVSAGKELDMTFRIIKPGGEVRHLKAVGEVQKDASGQPVRITGINYDITEQVEAEQEILNQSEILDRFFSSSLDLLCIVNSQGEFVRLNPEWEAVLGYSLEELTGRRFLDFVHPDDLQGTIEQTSRLNQGGIVDGFENRYRARNGQYRWIEWRSNAAGELIYAAARDITARKEAENQLIQLNEQLTSAVEYANELTVQAEMANIAKSEFLANMSHEIRTPMNGVIGMTGLLLDTDLNEEQRRYAEIVRSSGEALLGLINDILDFSKIEAGKLELETLNFDLGSLLDDFASTLAMRAHEKGLELLYHAEPDVPTMLQGDPGRLRQILLNLTNNAIKFTNTGEVDVRARLESLEGDRAVIRFSIRDTGIGIPVKRQHRLFQSFSQVDASTSRKYGGTGLGLAISRQLAEMMGGTIGFQSCEGQGSTFWFTAVFRLQKNGNHADRQIPAELSGVRVLIVDDNATNREILHIRMSSWGMRPCEASDGPLALAALHKAREEGDPFQLAVIDMQMPGMDGETLGGQVVSDPALSDTRLVMLTSLGDLGDARHFASIGFSGYLTKPVQPEELKGVLSLALAGSQGSSEIATRHVVREALPVFAGFGARILLAEDNITNQQVAQGVLKKLGLSADVVADGGEVLKALEAIPYDLILMDCQMPVVDGYEATRAIRNSDASYRDIPIIAMTAHAMVGDRERCIEAGMNDYISKPVSRARLAEKLEEWLPKTGNTTPGNQAA